MGQHLADAFGEDYYSLGLCFGTGEFTAPVGHDRETFRIHDLGGPTEDTPAATLADVSDPPFFLGFDAAREQAPVADWLTARSAVQFSVPRAASRGAVPLPASPTAVFDGVAFVRTASPASFSAGD
jgi:erythromycin esterase